MSSILFRRFLSASILIGVVSIAGRAVGLFKEMVVADSFGVSADLDTLYLGLMVPMYLLTSLTNPLASSFIPKFNEQRSTNEQHAMAMLRQVIAWLIFALGIGAISFLGLSKWIATLLEISPNQLPYFYEYSILFSVLMLLLGVSNFLTSLLENEKKFLFTSAGPIVSSLAIVGLVWLNPAVKSIAHGMLFGTSAFLLVQIFTLQFATKLSILPDLRFKKPDASFLKQYKLLFVGSLLMGSTFLVDQTMAAYLGEKSVSTLNYGFRVISLFTGIISLALGSVALPFFSELSLEKDYSGMKKLVNQLLGLTFLGSAVIIVSLFLFGDELVRLLFERGEFTEENTTSVAEILQYYALQLPFYVGGIILVRLIAVFGKNQIITTISGLNLAFNVLFNFIFIQWMGLKGIALSTSMVYFISFSLLWWQVFKIQESLKNENG